MHKLNLTQALGDVTRRHPGKHALFWGERELTYSQVRAQALAFASRLASLGVRPGDRVGLWLKNCPAFVAGFFGILEAGGAVVPINSFLKPDEINFILNDAGVDVVVTDPVLGSHHRALEAGRTQVRFLRVEELGLEPSSLEFSPGPGSRAERHCLAVIVYTSGTTGRPKRGDAVSFQPAA